MEQIPQPIEPVGMFSGLKIKAIAAGVLSDIITTFILGTILMSVILISEYGTEIPDEAIDNFFRVNRNLYLLLLLGTTCTVFGGFIGAKIAGSLEIRHGGWVGTISLLLSVVSELFSDQKQIYPRWFIYCSVAAAIPAGVLGGYLSVVFSKAQKSL
jgi:hypothetical protein